MTNLQQDDNSSQAQIGPPGTILGSVPTTPPPGYESDSYNKGGGDLPSFLFTGTPNRLKTKRKPLDWMAIARESAYVSLRVVLGVCAVIIGVFFFVLAATLLLNWLWSFGVAGKIASFVILVALIGAGAGAAHGYEKQRDWLS